MSFETNLRAAGRAIADVRFVCAFGAANKPVDVARNRTASGQGISLTTILDIMLVNDYTPGRRGETPRRAHSDRCRAWQGIPQRNV